MATATKEEVEARLGKKMEQFPKSIAEGILGDPDFQKSLNRYMLKTHVVWGAFMAATIVGLWNIILATNVSPWISGGVSFSVGLLGLLWSYIPLRHADRSTGPGTQRAAQE